MKTAIPSPDGIERRWHLIDAEDTVLGRLASKAAMMLQGKHKPSYTPSLDTGDHVVVVNAAKVRLTGRKEEQKLYRRHSGYPGGLTETSARKVRAAQMYRKLQVYAGPKHPHDAQKPVALSL
jgi:large subunit ribosomal protein L13